MLCEHCGVNEAAIYYSETINGVKRTAALCPVCMAALKNINKEMAFEPFSDMLLSGIFNDTVKKQSIQRELRTDKRCKTCGASLRDIAADGKVGCPDCYRTFREELAPTIARIHGAVSHKTVTPEPESKDERKELQASLNEAVKNENYELAAQLRDKIRALDSGA